MADVVRLRTYVDVADEVVSRSEGTASMSARHEAVLADGRCVLLLDDRGWSTTGGFESPAGMERTAREVVGPDESSAGRTPADMERSHWEFLARVLRQKGVEADASRLAELPHDVEFGDRLARRP